MTDIVDTGISGLNELLEGGYPKGSLILLVGNPGTGHSIICQQFLYNALSQGGSGIYFVTWCSSEDIKSNMSRFGWEVEEFEKSGNLTFIDVFSSRIKWVLGETHKKTPSLSSVSRSWDTSILNMLRLGVLENDELASKGSHIGVIDSLSDILWLHSLKEVKEVLEGIKAFVRIYKCVYLVSLEKGMHDESTLSTIEHVSDGIIELRVRERGNELERSICITNMLHIVPSSKIVPYRITQKGIVLDTATRIV
ncbi:MAG: RAD55 family ATPase [Candidatus Hydrothermarchaeota archaeon]